MEQRISYDQVAPEAYKAMLGIEKYLHRSGLEPKLMHMLKLRASQLNGCAYCIDMHSKDFLATGDTIQRVYGLDSWEESPYYSERERAALAWTEAVTLIRESRASDDVYDKVKAHFSEKEIVDLTWLIGAINLWNRVAISMRVTPGTYQPPQASH